MASIQRVVVMLCLMVASAQAGEMTFVHKKVHSKGLVGYPADLVNRIADMVDTYDQLYLVRHEVPIVVDECGSANAIYAPREHSIRMSHELWDDTFALSRLQGYDVDAAKRLANGVVMFAFFHELGHALIDELGLATSGKTEDTVDELATIVIGQAKELGIESAILGMQWLHMMAAAPTHKNAFHAAHAFDEEHVTDVACLLYASNPKRYVTLMKILKIPSDRLTDCLTVETGRRRAWDTVLAPHMRKPKG